MPTHYVMHEIPAQKARTHLVLKVPVPDAIYAVARDLTGEHFIHQPRVVPFDQGHDWLEWDGGVRLSPAVREGYWLVFRYGPEPQCCDNEGILQVD